MHSLQFAQTDGQLTLLQPSSSQTKHLYRRQFSVPRTAVFSE